MPNFDYFWGVDQLLVELGLIELWHLVIAHAFLLGIFFIANVMIINPLLRLINKRWLVASKCVATAVMGFAFLWPIIFGLLLLLLGDELSTARHLYIYFVLLVMLVASQIHIQIAVPNFQGGESDGGKISARDRVVQQQRK